MLENPLVPPNLLQTHVRSRSQADDEMTLDTALALPTKKRRGDLPLKKRYQSSVDAEQYVQNFLNFRANVKDEKNSMDSNDKCSPPDIPMDFSLPNRIRAVCKRETNDQLASDYKSFEKRIDHEIKPSDFIAQNGIFSLTPSIFNLNSSLPLASLRNGLLPQSLSSLNVPFTINFPFNFPSSPFIPKPLPDVSNSCNNGDPNINNDKADSLKRPCKRTKSKHWNNCQKLPISQSASNSDVDSIAAESYVINPATGNRVRRCYKNMTTERRMEANARERTRVHTIGAAFDRLRKMIPSLAHDQKLSKLSILRVSCSYIMLLAAMNDLDYSADSQGYTVEECTEMLSETIISEAKFKR